MKFQKALEQNPAPGRLGDTKIYLDPPVLVGEARKVRPWALMTFLLVSGFSLGLLAAFLTLGGHTGPYHLGVVALLIASAVCVTLASYLEQGTRRRRFVLDFAGYTLRLDFSSSIRGLPRSLSLAFDDVVDLRAVKQANGRKALTLDFERNGEVFREVLAAEIEPFEQENLERIETLLRNALGLKKAPTLAPMSESLFVD